MTGNQQRAAEVRCKRGFTDAEHWQDGHYACPGFANADPIAPATVSVVSVDPDLARRLATAGRKAEEWRTRRDNLIREAHRNGASLREIAAAVGLSNPGVLRIVRRPGADAD